MKTNCPYCEKEFPSSEIRALIHSAGSFKRKSDGKRIRRFRCLRCQKWFSHATLNACVHQKKRRLNLRLKLLLCSGVSQRRAAKILKISRTTVSRKFQFIARQAQTEFLSFNQNRKKADIVEFDDLETFEHTKFKPLSVTLAVESRTRRILGFQVARMPAKGLLSKRAIKKYGFRKDERTSARRKLFSELKPLVSQDVRFKSDQNPYYPKDLKRYFPNAPHEAFKGQRGSIVGQGELKKVRFDPLFSLNHTCAMLRANINRLFRKTWCTTKIPERLGFHLYIYANFHNKYLIGSS